VRIFFRTLGNFLVPRPFTSPEDGDMKRRYMMAILMIVAFLVECAFTKRPQS